MANKNKLNPIEDNSKLKDLPPLKAPVKKEAP